jgi:hypothetical protein
LDYWGYNVIWYDEIPKNKYLFINTKVEKQKLEEMELQEIEYLVYWHHKKSELDNFMNFPENLLSLELNWSNIQSFTGIERLAKLRRLELHYCTKLTNDTGLSYVADTLEVLEINQSKKFIPSKELFKLRNLRVLRLNNCGNLENLSFLKHFPKLISFSFVDTNILDGDLSPLIEHPTIRNAGFHNKRHYNKKYEEMEQLLKEKNGGKEFKSYYKKGKYQIFKYMD